MYILMIFVDGFEYSIQFESVSNSYIARIRSINSDWKDDKIKQVSFGNGVAAEEKLIEWMSNPMKFLNDEVLK